MRSPVKLGNAYRMLSPGTLVLVSSLYKGRAGLTPSAWSMPISDEPPVVALLVWHAHFIYRRFLRPAILS